MIAKQIEDLKARRRNAFERSRIVRDVTEHERLRKLVISLTDQIKTLEATR